MEKPWAETIYRPAAALEFFKAAGKPEKAPAGTAFFAENEKARPYFFMRDKMYLLLDGSVDLVARRKVIGSVAKGQIFGEMASITHAPRSATAVAKTACKVIALDDKQFRSGLQKKPDFALMLMSIMIGRLRETIARLAEQTTLRGDAVREGIRRLRSRSAWPSWPRACRTTRRSTSTAARPSCRKASPACACTR